jgi:hypothetical protein
MTWCQTHTGRPFDLLDPRPHEVRIDDLTVQLGGQPRFNRATTGTMPYGIAQHSCLVADLMPRDAPPRWRLLAILHDAHEAYTGDITSPMKLALRALDPRATDALASIQDRVQGAIHRAFGVHPHEWDDAAPAHAAVKRADLRALAIEKRDLMAPCAWKWDALPDVSDWTTPLAPLGAYAAGLMWRRRAVALVRAAGCTPLASLGV